MQTRHPKSKYPHSHGFDSGEQPFDLVPASLIETLQNNSLDWKTRASAIESIQMNLQTLDFGRFVVLKPQIQSFIQFLAVLLRDPHFKIIFTSLQIIDEITDKIGSLIDPYLSILIPALIDQYSDPKSAVRHKISKILIKLMHECTPKPVISECMHFLSHEEKKVREELVNIIITSLLVFHDNHLQQFDIPGLIADLITPLHDHTAKVRYLAVEAYAVVSHFFSPERVLIMLKDYGIDLETVKLLKMRFMNPEIPQLGLNGLVEHAITRSNVNSPRPPSSARSSVKSFQSCITPRKTSSFIARKASLSIQSTPGENLNHSRKHSKTGSMRLENNYKQLNYSDLIPENLPPQLKLSNSKFRNDSKMVLEHDSDIIKPVKLAPLAVAPLIQTDGKFKALPSITTQK
ncbi:hypothetical protein HK096_000318, partial [Nowakowskiella sp. JEL0078]